MRIFTVFMFVAFLKLSVIATPSFTENKGQIRDQHYQPRPDVLFSGSANGLYYHLKKDGLHYQLFKVENWKKEENRKRHLLPEEQTEVPDKIGIYRVDVNWLNTSAEAKIIREKELPGYNHYYNVPENTEPALFVKSYESIRYQNIYNGIDLHFYTSEGNLEYDFLVQPYADYKQIQIQIKGATLKVSDKKELIIQTPFGEIVEGALKVFQDGKQIAADWVVRDNVVSFHIPKYDKSKPLRIDPLVLVWGTYYGGSSDEHGWGTTLDAAENVFLTGWTGSLNSIATVGAHQIALDGLRDAFLTKFNANGVRLWGTYYGGNNFDEAFAVCTDATGNVYITGQTSSANGIATAGTHQVAYNDAGDAFIAKFDNNGIRLWGTYFGGEQTETSSGIATRGNDVFIIGTTSSETDIATVGAFKTVFDPIMDITDMFLAKFNTSGIRQWATYFGGIGIDYGLNVTIDVNGNAIIGGDTESSADIATVGAHQTTIGGSRCGVLAKFGNGGALQWSTYYGGTDNIIELSTTIVGSVTTDAAGNIYAAGGTTSNFNVATAGTHQSTLGGNWDAFLVKFNAAGVRQWATYYGGSAYDYGTEVELDALNNIYLAGIAVSSNNIATTPAHQTAPNGGRDAFLVKFNAAGVRQAATYYGGSEEDNCFSLSVSPQGVMYVAGRTYSTADMATTGAHQETLDGTNDAFLAKFVMCVPLQVNVSSNGPLCEGQDLHFSADSIPDVTYDWSGPDGFTSDAKNPSILGVTLAAAGDYTLIVTEPNGCQTVEIIQVEVYPQPLAVPGSNSPLCVGDDLQLTADTVVGAGYHWDGPAGFVSLEQNPFIPDVSFAQSGIYTLTVTSAVGCSNSASISVMINALPSDSVYQSNDTLWAYQAGADYQWVDCDNNNSFISGETHQYFKPSVNGNYAVIIMLPEGCSITSPCYDFSTVSLHEISSNNPEWKIFPNPANESFTVFTTRSGLFELYDVNGRLLDTFFVKAKQPFVYRHSLPQGIYLTRNTESGETRRIIIQLH